MVWNIKKTYKNNVKNSAKIKKNKPSKPNIWKNLEGEMFLNWHLLDYLIKQKFWNKTLWFIKEYAYFICRTKNFLFLLNPKANFRLLEISQKRANLDVIHLTLAAGCPQAHCWPRWAQYQKRSDSRDTRDWLWKPQPAARQQSTRAKQRVGTACCEAAYPAAA